MSLKMTSIGWTLVWISMTPDLLLLAIKHKFKRFELRHQARKDGSSPKSEWNSNLHCKLEKVDLWGLSSMKLLTKDEANQDGKLMILVDIESMFEVDSLVWMWLLFWNPYFLGICCNLIMNPDYHGILSN